MSRDTSLGVNLNNYSGIWYLILIAIIGGIFSFTINSIGVIGYWPDSISYISVAESLLAGRGFYQYDGTPFTHWPPLYPLLIFYIKYLTHWDYTIITNFINAIAMSLFLFYAGYLLYIITGKKFVYFFSSIYVLTANAIIQRWQWAGTEALFIFISICFIFYISIYTSNSNNIYFVISSLLAALAVLLRYIGAIFFLLILFVILFQRNHYKKLIEKMGIFFIASIPALIWIIGNYILTNSFFGIRGSSRYTFFHNALATIIQTYRLFYPVNYKTTLSLIIIAILLAILVVGVLKFRDKVRFLINPSQKLLAYKIFVISLGFIALYLIFLVITSTLSAYDAINTRFLSPILIPSVICLSYIFNCVYRYKQENRVLYYGIILLVALSLISNLFADYQSISQQLKEGLGYNSKVWTNSELVSYLLNTKLFADFDSKIYSNDPHAVYYFTKQITNWSPLRRNYNSNDPPRDIYEVKKAGKEFTNGYLVWFNTRQRDYYLFSLKEISAVFELDTLFISKDGFIFRVLN